MDLSFRQRRQQQQPPQFNPRNNNNNEELPTRRQISARLMMMMIICKYPAIAILFSGFLYSFVSIGMYLGEAMSESDYTSMQEKTKPSKHYLNNLYWSDLDEEARDAATMLGYDKEYWDHDRYPPIFETPFANLNLTEKEAARYLHMVSDFPVFRSGEVSWFSLNVPAQDAANLLGYNETLWNQHYPIPILMNRTTTAQRREALPSNILTAIEFLGLDFYHDLSRLQKKNGNYNVPRFIDTVELTKKHHEKLADQKILLYITTHLSDTHISALKYVWPHALKSSHLLSQADVLVHYTINDEQELDEQNDAVSLMKIIFESTGNKVTIPSPKQNVGYQEGAIQAISDALKNDWFTPYDWIIRVNPDVIIRNDTWIIHQMINPSNVGAILVDCSDKYLNTVQAKVHTDFSIFQPKYIKIPSSSEEIEDLKSITNAEHHFSKLMEEVLTTGQAAILPDNDPNHGYCRVQGDKSSVVHDHTWIRGMVRCLPPFVSASSSSLKQEDYFSKCNSINIS